MYGRLTTWLEIEPRGFLATSRMLLKFFGANLALIVLQLSALLLVYGWDLPPDSNGENVYAHFEKIIAHRGYWALLPLLIFGAVFEEILFRLAPLRLTSWLTKRNVIGLLGATLCSSLVFGLAHDFNLQGVIIQGFGGILYSILYLKCGGMNNRSFKALTCSSAAHFAHNCLFVGLSFLLTFLFDYQ